MTFLCSSPETGLSGGTVGTERSLTSRGTLKQGTVRANCSLTSRGALEQGTVGA